MKLASIKSDSKDGQLVVVSKDNLRFTKASHIAPNLRSAIETWYQSEKELNKLYEDLNSQKGLFQQVQDAQFLSPLPRSFQWIDGSTFIQHIKLVRKSRNASLPETLTSVPLVYQGSGDSFLTPTENIPQRSEQHGTDFEGEVAVVLTDVPMGVNPKEALNYIVLFLLVNDVSLRALAPEELKRGFGFLQSKPSSSFAPFAVTQTELGQAYKDGRIHLPLSIRFNGQFFGKANAGEMHFHFGQVISHCAKTRHLTAGTIIGSGTVSNEDTSVGSSCLVEKRTLEKLQSGKAKQRFMQAGDHIEMKMLDEQGHNIFGTISQKVVSVP